MSSIEPALTAKEWADVAEDLEWWAARVSDIGREASEWLLSYDVRPLAAAALCLHGRISWAMVDALRLAASEIEGEWGYYPEGVQVPPFDPGNVKTAPQVLEALADLLESLLPPREG